MADDDSDSQAHQRTTANFSGKETPGLPQAVDRSEHCDVWVSDHLSHREGEMLIDDSEFIVGRYSFSTIILVIRNLYRKEKSLFPILKHLYTGINITMLK